MATLLPGVEFSTRSPYPDARRLFDAGVTVALSTDCNPGSSFTSSMPFCIAVAVREMGMTPDEAVHAATAGGARALRRTDVGRIGAGCPRRPRPARRALSTCTLPTGRVCRWSARSGARAYAASNSLFGEKTSSQALQCPRQQPGDVHLGDPQLLADLGLREVADEPQRKDLALAR